MSSAAILPIPPVDRRAYAELQCLSNFSFLEGASSAVELVQQAAYLGLQAIAVTDRNSLAGVVRAHVAAKNTAIPRVLARAIKCGPNVFSNHRRRREGSEAYLNIKLVSRA